MNRYQKEERSTRGNKPWERISQKRIRRLVYHVLEAIDSPRSLAIFLILKEADESGGCDDEALSFTTDPLLYANEKDFRDAYWPTELIRKFEGLRLSCDPTAEAVRKFSLAEEQCQKTNSRLALDQDPDGRYDPLLDRMRKDLDRLLADFSSEDIEGCFLNGGWGKGVTSSCKGVWLSEYHKLGNIPQSTQALNVLASAFWAEAFPGLHSSVEVVDGSTLAFVPKDARSHRSICVEPSVNAFIQRGIGLFIRRRLLKRWGLDLTAQEPNQELAKAGSLDGSLATIDLSSASDTIAYGLVQRLIPERLLALLGATRCTFTTYKGKKQFLHKWSSMGNGYTFELETAIFAAAVRAVLPKRAEVNKDYRIYGDDIIVKTEYFEELCQLLNHLGFSLNDRKTFATTPFRESCGADYYNGVNVRPFYLKKVDWIQVVELTNWIRSSMSEHYPHWRTAWHECVKALGPDCPSLPGGPHGLTGVWINPEDHPRLSLVNHEGEAGYWCKGLSWTARELPSLEREGLAAVYAHLRSIKGQGGLAAHLANPIDFPLSEPWRIAATKQGRWVRRRRFLKGSLVEWLPSL